MEQNNQALNKMAQVFQELSGPSARALQDVITSVEDGPERQRLIDTILAHGKQKE